MAFVTDKIYKTAIVTKKQPVPFHRCNYHYASLSIEWKESDNELHNPVFHLVILTFCSKIRQIS